MLECMMQIFKLFCENTFLGLNKDITLNTFALFKNHFTNKSRVDPIEALLGQIKNVLKYFVTGLFFYC